MLAPVTGVWAAMTTPFNGSDGLDEGAFRENVRRLAAAGVHGIYTTDADGEFYAIESDEFERLARILADEARRAGVAAHMGVTWTHTRGVVRRLQIAADAGISGAHVGHPFFMELSRASLEQYWSDIAQAAAPGFQLVHYNSLRMPNQLLGPDYAMLAGRIPNLVATKQVTSDTTQFAAIVEGAPRLSHLVGEQAFVAFMLLGASGVCSWFANFNPGFMLDWYRECVEGRWEEARLRQRQMDRFIAIKRECFASLGAHAVVNKAMAAASDLLVGSPRTRRPYLSVDTEIIKRFRERVAAELPDVVWHAG